MKWLERKSMSFFSHHMHTKRISHLETSGEVWKYVGLISCSGLWIFQFLSCRKRSTYICVYSHQICLQEEYSRILNRGSNVCVCSLERYKSKLIPFTQQVMLHFNTAISLLFHLLNYKNNPNLHAIYYPFSLQNVINTVQSAYWSLVLIMYKTILFYLY